MRMAWAVVFAAAACLSQEAAAQEWAEYVNRADRFSINFPGAPEVEAIEYQPSDGPPVPAHVYRAAQGENRYTLTVVDFTQDYEFSTWPFVFSGANEVQGALAHAAANLRQRGEVTYDAYDRLNLIPGHLLQITEPDGRRLFAGIYLYDRRLYIMEASVPAGAAPPMNFRTSLAILDSEGVSIRYDEDGKLARGGPPVELLGQEP